MRLFVAVPLPSEVRRRLAAIVASAGGVDDAIRWTAEEQLHCTLKFLGDVTDAAGLAAIVAALDGACNGARAFPIGINGFGAFPPGRPPRVLWAGLDAAPPLELLQDAVERALTPLGFPPDGQPFRPHVTVGRVRRGRSGGRTAERLAAAECADTFTVDRVVLMESTLARGGARHTERHVIPLVS